MNLDLPMQFGIILSIDCTKDDDLSSYLPREEIMEKLDQTEDDSEQEYDYLEGWEDHHHTKLCGFLEEEDFAKLVEDVGLYASTTETMGIIGAPWTPSGMGWAPAMAFEADGSDAIISMYVTPFPEVGEDIPAELSEEDWKAICEKVLKKYGA